MKAHGVGGVVYAFLIMALVGSGCLLSFPGRFASREGPTRVPWLTGSERRSERRSEQNGSHRERP